MSEGVLTLLVLSPWLLLLGACVAVGIAYPSRTTKARHYAEVDADWQSVFLKQDEAVLLGPISAWVAEGEARAVRDWEQAQRERSKQEWIRRSPESRVLHGLEPPADISDYTMVEIR